MSLAQPDDAWELAPAGLLRLDRDGRVLAANRTALGWLRAPAEQVAGRHLTELLSVGGRLYWETHLWPLLLVEGRVDEVALELRAGPDRMPVLMSAVLGERGTEVALSSARERVRFERELQGARRAARTSEQQVRSLHAITAALSTAVGVDAVARALLAAVTGPLRAAGGTLWLPGPDGLLHLSGSTGTQDDGRPVPPEVGPPDDRQGAVEAVAVDEDGRVVLPLRGLTGLRGALALQPATGAGADPLDLDVCTAVAQQAGLALDRAQTYEQSAAVAHQLQVALLAMEPPPDERYDVATYYRPGVEALEVGGDWYDVFLSGPGVLAVVVGDVVGRGLAAASAMGQLRSAVRAVAAPGVGPAQLLARLDHFVEQVPAAAMATLAYAEVHLATGRMRYACAGHLPPLLAPAAGGPRLLWGGRSAPLGSLLAPQERPEAELLLSPDDRLLLCTDGLIERRDRDLDDGLQRLVDSAGALAGAALQESVAAVTGSLLADEQTRDDVCLLLLRWLGDRFERDMPGDLTGLSTTRQALAGWLRTRGVGEPVLADLVLAASEALANAAEHGAGRRADERVCLTAWIEPGERAEDDVVLSVSDRGRWRPTAAASAERGRGLKIISAMVDTVDVQSRAGTTVVLRRRVREAS